MRQRLGDGKNGTRRTQGDRPRANAGSPQNHRPCEALSCIRRQVKHVALTCRSDLSPPAGLARLLLASMLIVALLAALVACAVQTAPRGAAPEPPSSPTADAATPGREPTAAETARRAASPPNFLSTSGNKIVDAGGDEVRLTGVNWFGLETGTFSPHGLWARNWEDMLDQIVDLGYNTIRLPYSNRILDPNARPIEGIDFNLNPDLKGLTGLEIMDKIVLAAGERNLKIILDRHRPDTESQSKLWYTDEVTEEQWIADWVFLAERYKGNDTVIGADLHNEPAGDATWGTGDARTDWRLAAEKCGNAILAVNPDWLIIVEGIEKTDGKWYWMGGDLRGVAEHPVRLSRPDKLVYSPHDYGPGVYQQGWFNDPSFPENLPGLWETHWSYIAKEGIAPILLGEFGGRSVSENDTEGIWQRTLLAYIKEHGLSYTYWCFNPNSVDTGGILTDDWRSVHEEKQNLLAANQAPLLPVNRPDVINIGGTPAPRKTPLPAIPLRVTAKGGEGREATSEMVLDLRIVNATPFRAPLEHAELRYWLNLDLPAGDGEAAAHALTLDWASVGDVSLELVPVQEGEPKHF